MIKKTNMDSDEGSKQKTNSDYCVDDSDVPKPIGLRCTFLYDIESDKFLWDYCCYFLPIVSIIFYSIFLFVRY